MVQEISTTAQGSIPEIKQAKTLTKALNQQPYLKLTTPLIPS